MSTSPDGDNDGGPNDGASVKDGVSTDGVSHTDSGAPPGDGGAVDAGNCSWFCDNFDTDTWPPGGGWSAPGTGMGGQIGFTADAASTAPRALESLLNTGTTGEAQGILSRTNNGSVAALHCTLDVEIVSFGDDSATVLTIGGTRGPGYYLYLTVSNTGTEYTENGVGTSLPALTPGTITNIGITLALGVPTVLTINGAVQSLKSATPSDAGAFSSVELTLGATRTAGDGTQWLVHHDNVACAIAP